MISKGFQKKAKNIPRSIFEGYNSPQSNVKVVILYSCSHSTTCVEATKNFTTPYSIPFASILHQSKDLHNFHKRRQHLIARRIKGLHQDLLFYLKQVVFVYTLGANLKVTINENTNTNLNILLMWFLSSLILNMHYQQRSWQFQIGKINKLNQIQ